MDDIHSPQTREYFKEVMSSYSIGNYRSAVVMLYSVAVCDMLLKLQELDEMYNDSKAKELLNYVNKQREDKSGSRSSWEKEFIDKIYHETKLLDQVAYTNLSHLYDDRNFSAHPAMNENYELRSPTKETTIAHIKNVLKDILVKPPVFIKDVINMLTDDLKNKKIYYNGISEELATYLNNKYYSKMTRLMKEKTMKALWKFCFRSVSEECQDNIAINRRALSILIGGFEAEALQYIKENKDLFSVDLSPDNPTRTINIFYLLCTHEKIYDQLNTDTKQQVDTNIDRAYNLKALSWFKYTDPGEHFKELRTDSQIKLKIPIVNLMYKHYFDIGEQSKLIDFFIWHYGNSVNFTSANYRFGQEIEPVLKQMNSRQFKELIRVTNINSQLYARDPAINANNKIMKIAKDILEMDFPYKDYPHFEFDKDILGLAEETEIDDSEYEEEDEEELPF